MRHALGSRLALFYGGHFAAIGVLLPFWPVWLQEARGLGPGEIGLLLAAAYWPRVATSLLIARAADRLGERRRPMIALSALTLAGFALFGLAEGFWPLMALSLLTGASFAALLPLGEALALAEAKDARIDYGRVRLWGSIGFIAAAIGGGWLLARTGAPAILALIVVLLTLCLLTCLLLPERPPPALGRALPTRALWRRPGFLGFVLAGASVQASHSVYYGFATIHWREAGLGESVIGWLWAEGVAAEILLFLCAGRALERSRPHRILALAGLLAAARWALSALSTEVLILAVAQALHAASFGAAHLATMYYLRDQTPSELHASAQGAYAALTALAFGLLTPLSGWLYAAQGGRAFLVMALVALAGAGLAASRPGLASDRGRT